jgi:hypothetical protein
MEASSTRLQYTIYVFYIYLLLLYISAIKAIFRQLVQSLLLATNMHIGQHTVTILERL